MGSDGMARGAPFGEAVGAASTTTSPRLPRRVRLAFGPGIGGSTIVDRIVFMWLYYFWVRGAVEGGQAYVPPVLFGVIVFGGRVLDAVTDPVVARWSDNHRGRLGRRRPFLLCSSSRRCVDGQRGLPRRRPGCLLHGQLWRSVYLGAYEAVFGEQRAEREHRRLRRVYDRCYLEERGCDASPDG